MVGLEWYRCWRLKHQKKKFLAGCSSLTDAVNNSGQPASNEGFHNK